MFVPVVGVKKSKDKNKRECWFGLYLTCQT